MESLPMTHHGTLTADYGNTALAVHMDSACVFTCARINSMCVYLHAQKTFFCKKLCVCCVSTMSYSFSLTHNNMCVCGWVYTDTFSSKTSKLCVQSDVNVCASHYFRSLLTKWNPVLAISPPQHPFTVPVLSTQY